MDTASFHNLGLRTAHRRLLLLAFAALASAQSSASAKPPRLASSISNISAPLSPSFAGFGIEPSNLYSFTGAASPNVFSLQLFQNLADYAGAPPHIRVGGNTADYMIYDGSYNSYFVATNPHPTGQGAIPCDLLTVGPTYWAVIDRLPPGSPVTVGLNLAYEAPDWPDKISAMAQGAVSNLKRSKLYSFEIGNEPDLYHQNGFRNATYDSPTYTKEWLSRAQTVWSNVTHAAGLPSAFFEPAATASTIGTDFEIDILIQNGIQKGAGGANTFVSAWNQHDYFYFVGVSTYALTLDLLQKFSGTEVQFKVWAGQVKQAGNTGLPYQLREMASVGPTGLQGLSDTFGAALWTLNFFCYAASLNISSVEMHMTDNSYAAAWAPIAHNGYGPNVRPSYAAHAAMAQIIGTGNGTTQIAALPLDGIDSAHTDYVRAYTFYNNGALAGIVLINGKVANSTTAASDRAGVRLDLTLDGVAGQNLWLNVLQAPGAEVTSGATWNGISYDSNADGTPKQLSSMNDVASIGSDGRVSFAVQDSQAVVATVNFTMGTGRTGTRLRSAAGHIDRSQRAPLALVVALVCSLWILASV